MASNPQATAQTAPRLQFDWLKSFSVSGLSFYGLLLASGFCGISYEILYARVLGNLMGDQMIVSASILMTFLLGIGIGTKYAYRLWPYLWAIELGIGACGILFAFGTPTLNYVLFHSGSILGQTMFGSVFACIALLAVPSILIGCSLPLFAGYLSRQERGQVFGKAYTIYNIGAAITALLIEFWLVRTFGLQGALLSIAALNLFVGITLYRHYEPLRCQRPQTISRVEFPWNHKLAIALVSVGSAIFQLMMIKVAECLFGPFHETFALVLATVLLGIAAGSLLTERLQIGFDSVVCMAIFGLAWFLWGFDTVAEAYAASYSTAAEEYWSLVWLKFRSVLCLMGVPAMAFGATIPAMLKEQRDVARESGELLFISSIANAAGFLLMAFVLHQAFSYGMMTVIVACLAGAGIVVRYGWQPKLLLATAVLVLMAAGSHHKVWDEDLLYVGHTSYHSTEDFEDSLGTMDELQVFKGHQDIFAITTIDEEDYFFINGYISIPLSSPSERIVGAFSSIFAPKTDNALVLGVGSGATAGTVGQIFDKTTAVEINPVILENLHRMSQYNFDIENNDRVDIVLNDAIHHVKTDPQEYSLIINTVTTPLYFSSSKLYTNDFLREVRHRLAPDGVYVTWFDGRVGNHGLDIVLKTIKNNFKYCSVGCVKSAYFLLLCSDEPIHAHNPGVVANSPTLSEQFYEEHGFNPDWFAYAVLCGDAFKLIDNRSARLNTLNYPSLEFEMSRLRGFDIDKFIARLTERMNLRDQQNILEPETTWDPNALLSHMDELLGDSTITDRWIELVEQKHPEAYDQVRWSRLTRYADAAESEGTAEAYFDYGFQLMELEQYELAIEQFNQAMELDEVYNDLHFNIAACYENLGNFEKALEYYRDEMNIDPVDEDVPFRIGRTALELGLYGDAIPAMRRAIEIYDDSENHQLLGQALAGTGHTSEAIRELITALDMDPQNKTARQELARLRGKN